MKKHWIALGLLLMAATAQAFTERTASSAIHGTWYNPNYNGEGFVFENYANGLVIGYWYTYDDMGNQLWMIGTGELVDDTVILEMTITEGGKMGSVANAVFVERETWGTITLVTNGCDSIDMSYEGIDGSTGGYRLDRITDANLSGTDCVSTSLDFPPLVTILECGVTLYGPTKILCNGVMEDVLTEPEEIALRISPSPRSYFLKHYRLRVMNGPVTVAVARGYVNDMFNTSNEAVLLGVEPGQQLMPGEHDIYFVVNGTEDERVPVQFQLSFTNGQVLIDKPITYITD